MFEPRCGLAHARRKGLPRTRPRNSSRVHGIASVVATADPWDGIACVDLLGTGSCAGIASGSATASVPARESPPWAQRHRFSRRNLLCEDMRVPVVPELRAEAVLLHPHLPELQDSRTQLPKYARDGASRLSNVAIVTTFPMSAAIHTQVFTARNRTVAPSEFYSP